VATPPPEGFGAGGVWECAVMGRTNTNAIDSGAPTILRTHRDEREFISAAYYQKAVDLVFL
ncbi:MAG: hypothetical protein WB723_15335, partial [Candidatus Acidiferrales bacterium]